MIEPYSQPVMDDIEIVVSIEFTRLGLIRKTNSRLIVGLCTDGIVAGTIVVDLWGKAQSIVTLQISESTMQNLANSDLLVYFQRNQKYAHQSMGEYCAAVAQGMPSRANN